MAIFFIYLLNLRFELNTHTQHTNSTGMILSVNVILYHAIKWLKNLYVCLHIIAKRLRLNGKEERFFHFIIDFVEYWVL